MRAVATPAAPSAPYSATHSVADARADEIAIIGAGPVGLTTALLLASHGLRSILIEAQAADSVRVDRRLLALSRGTLDLLRPLLGSGLVLAPINDVWVSSAGQFGATHLSAHDFDGAALGATAYYGELVRALVAAVNAQPQISWRRPARVAAIEQRPADVVVRLEQGETLCPCCVVHAEGRADVRTPAERAPAAVIADIRLSGAPADAAFERFTRTGPLALLPAPADTPTWGLVWCFDDDTEAQRCAALGDSEFVRQLQALLGARRVRVTLAGPRRKVSLPAYVRTQVHAFRQIWLGNAAQTLHPVAGQGFNLGVRDGAVLSECLAAVRSGPSAPTSGTATMDVGTADSQQRFCAGVPAALARYAQRRGRDRATIGAVTRWLPDAFVTRFAPIAAARGAALIALDLLPPLRRQWAHLLMFGVRA